MNIRSQINSMFAGKAFDRPLFYQYPGGLRFSLSEGGHILNQFLTALWKAETICREILQDSDEMILCLRIYSESCLLDQIKVLRELKSVDLYPTSDREYWSETEGLHEDENFASPGGVHSIAFSIPVDRLQNVLWCALAKDFDISPRPQADFYLFCLDKQIMILPYDDRGMDVVGSNHQLLKTLYHRFDNWLLDYDRQQMNSTFRTEE
ncbi:DUF3885 domain-containing protein [Gimesia algae]|uniref:DUF3885 domain-containing protein n=1 Tax=Gimesia algae TaxID=2527971 RepID=A0A517VIE7_9PLAN|nr:DUF3885 domain-containing protein [Gimesia algae]QDT92752.1 hypothetical protein Pan161_44220 [Gimesia algae]